MDKQLPRSLDLSGKVAVVTGARRGIGRATADLLRARGAQLVVSDRSDEVEKMGADDVATYVGDASVEATARATIQLAADRFGRLDILVNNAGRSLNEPIEDTTVDAFDEILRINARGNFLHAREAMRAMKGFGNGGAMVFRRLGLLRRGVRDPDRLRSVEGSDRPDRPRSGHRGRTARHPLQRRRTRRDRDRPYGERRGRQPGVPPQLR